MSKGGRRLKAVKIRFERGDTAFEVEKEPMPPERFRTVCAVWLAVLYVAAVVATLALCGEIGFLVVLLLSLAFGGTLCAVLKVELI